MEVIVPFQHSDPIKAANDLLRLNYENIGVEIQAPAIDTQILLEEHNLPRLSEKQIINFYRQFKCYEIIRRKHSGGTPFDRDCVVRLWDAGDEENKEDSSRCRDCFFYDNCDLVPKLNDQPDKNYQETMFEKFHEIVHHNKAEIAPSQYGVWMFEEEHLKESIRKNRGLRLVQYLQTLADMTMDEIVDFLNVPYSVRVVREKMDKLNLDKRGPKHRRHPFCEVLQWKKRYEQGEFAFEILGKDESEAVNCTSIIIHALKNYGFDPSVGKDIRSYRASRYNKQGNTAAYEPLHSTYLSWAGTAEEFEEKYDINWKTLTGYYRTHGYEVRTDRARAGKKRAAKKYSKLHKAYMNWEGHIQDFEELYKVKWKSMHKWFKTNNYEYRKPHRKSSS